MQPKTPFLREATGLVREVKAFDAWVFGVMCISIGTGVSFLYTLGPALFPGGSIPIAVGVFAIILIFKDLLYAQLGTAMPRSGGEYVFQARILDRILPWAVGNQLSYNVIWQGCIFQALNGVMIATIGLAPLAYFVGLLIGNAALLSFGAWSSTPVGLYIIIVASSALSVTVAALGIKFYMETFQRPLFIFGMLEAFGVMYLFATNSQADFISKFNTFAQPYYNQADSFHYIITTAHNLGLNTQFSWVSTVGLMAFVAFGLIWSHSIVHNFGEAKKANDLKTYSWVFVGGTLFTAIFMLIIGWQIVNLCGIDFLSSIGYLGFIQGGSAYPIPIPPFHTMIASVLTNNIWWIILINGGLLAWAIQWDTNNSIGYSRLVLALSFDRVLPAKLGDVNDRFHSPVNALLLFFVVGGLGFGALVAFLGLAWAFSAAVLAQIFNFITTGLAGVCFPYTKKDMFRASPSSRWMIGKVPFVVICGLITLVSQLVLMYTFVAIPGVGISDPRALGVVFAVIAFGITWFLGIRWYRKTRQGIDLNDLFRALPPE